MIKVIGVGPGRQDLLTFLAIEEVNKADVLVAGKRNIDWILNSGLFNLDQKKLEKLYITRDMEGLKHEIGKRLNKSIVVLASGDPSIYGIASYIIKNFPNDQVDVIPGISAIQYLFAKAKLDMNDLYITSSHGKEPPLDLIKMLDKVAMVTDSNYSVDRLARDLLAMGEQRLVVLGENLAMEDEKISFMDLNDLAVKKCSPLTSVIFIKNDLNRGKNEK